MEGMTTLQDPSQYRAGSASPFFEPQLLHPVLHHAPLLRGVLLERLLLSRVTLTDLVGVGSRRVSAQFVLL